MIDYIIGFAIIIVVCVACVAFGIAVGAHGAEKNENSASEYFLKRDAYRQREKALKKELEETKTARDDWKKEALVLRDEVKDLNLELGDVKLKLRKEKEKRL